MTTYRTTQPNVTKGKALMPQRGNHCFDVTRLASRLFAAALVVAIAFASLTGHAATSGPKQFATVEEAVTAFIAALKAGDEKGLLAILGEAGKELVASGDPVSDQQRRELFIREYEMKHRLSPEGDKMVLAIGEKEWPFPVPLAKKGDVWFFDTRAGKEEILNRRIGANELSTVQTLLAVIDAQREYAMEDRDGDGIREYAQKFGSDAGRKNGLFWETLPGEEPSPLGELVADARAEGYSQKGKTRQGPVPFHGYYFRILTKQGKHAPGGAFDYLVKDNLIGGVAVLAYPAVYGSSGVMTFMVNHLGVVYEKDLGKNTAKTAAAMQSFDPDKSWRKVD
jgi:hypothetical protein